MNENILTDAELLSMAVMYIFVDPVSDKSVRIEKRNHKDGSDWIAINAEKFVLSDKGEWVWKPIFDHMDADYLYHTGFPNPRAAIFAAKKALGIV